MMKLVFIYGPPASGKLTVARAVAAATSFRLFHNHLASDLALSIFDYGTKGFAELCIQLRLNAMEAAAKADLPGLIFTYCYAAPRDHQFIANVKEVVARHRGTVCFVRLYTDRAILEERVVSPARTQFRKLATVADLATALGRHDYFSEIPSPGGLKIDNSHKTPQEIAESIINHFELGVA
jgi:hypothetical protein